MTLDCVVTYGCSLCVDTDVDDSRDWVVTHGRSIALSVGLKDASARILSAQNQPRIKKALVAFCSADRVRISLYITLVHYFHTHFVCRECLLHGK